MHLEGHFDPIRGRGDCPDAEGHVRVQEIIAVRAAAADRGNRGGVGSQGLGLGSGQAAQQGHQGKGREQGGACKVSGRGVWIVTSGLKNHFFS